MTYKCDCFEFYWSFPVQKLLNPRCTKYFPLIDLCSQKCVTQIFFSVLRDFFSLAFLFSMIRTEIHHRMHLFWGISQETLKITDKSVDIALATCFQDNVLVVIITKTPRQLLVIHLWLVFPDAPSSSNLVRIRHFKLPAIACPADEVLACFVCEQLEQKLPELNWSTAREARALGGWRGDGLDRATLTTVRRFTIDESWVLN